MRSFIEGSVTISYKSKLDLRNLFTLIKNTNNRQELEEKLNSTPPNYVNLDLDKNGKIDFIGRKGAYGKYIKIRHNETYSTAYAHMQNFARGVRRGSRVSQGQIIGYVGTTGRSTGPHLHYEILVKNKRTNPLKIKMPLGKKLRGNELKLFLSARQRIDDQFSLLSQNVKLLLER